MNKQQVTFNISDNRHFKSDQLTEEELRFKLSSLEREILKLQSVNSNLKKSLDCFMESQVSELDQADTTELSEMKSLARQLSEENGVSWGARYKSRNPEVKDIKIPIQAEPDHVYTNDTVELIVEKSCDCDEPNNIEKLNVKESEDMVTRKLLITRERNIHFDCSCCGESSHHKMIEKHLEAELYCKNLD